MMPAQHADQTHADRSVPPGGGAEGASATISDGLDQLETLGQRPLREHVGVFADLHAALQASLNEIDRG